MVDNYNYSYITRYISDPSYTDNNPETKAQVLELMANLDDMMSKFEVHFDLHTLQIPGEFRKADGSIMTDYAEIRTKFLELAKEQPQPNITDHLDCDTWIKRVCLGRGREEIIRVENDLARRRSDLDHYQNEVRNYERYVENSEAELRMIARRNLKRVTNETQNTEEVKSAINLATFFKRNPNQTQVNDYLCLITAPVVLTYKKPNAGIDITVRLGEFKVKLYQSLEVKVIAHTNNIITGDHYHPHVSSGGAICFGNKQAEYEQAKDNCDVGKVLHLVRLVLTEYCDEVPYLSIQRFHEAYCNKVGIQAPDYTRERSGTYEDDDGYERCRECEEYVDDCTC